MPQLPSGRVSELLARWGAGDEEAFRALVPLVYHELRRIAHRYLQKERPGHTLQSTALVHEAYLRLNQQGAAHPENRAHFFAMAAELMRQILVDYARSRRAAKRGGGQELTLDDATYSVKNKSVDLIALDHALSGLAKPRSSAKPDRGAAFFRRSVDRGDVAGIGISPASAKRKSATARVWLHHEMSRTA